MRWAEQLAACRGTDLSDAARPTLLGSGVIVIGRRARVPQSAAQQIWPCALGFLAVGERSLFNWSDTTQRRREVLLSG